MQIDAIRFGVAAVEIVHPGFIARGCCRNIAYKT